MGDYLNIFKLTNKEVHFMMIDITRAVTLVVIVQLLFFVFDNHGTFNSILTIKNILYIIIAMVFYNLVIIKILGLDRNYKKVEKK